jgi:hypothetical protein
MKIKYETISVNPPPLDVDVLFRMSKGTFSQPVRVMVFHSKYWDVEDMVEQLICDGYIEWAEV